MSYSELFRVFSDQAVNKHYNLHLFPAHSVCHNKAYYQQDYIASVDEHVIMLADLESIHLQRFS